MKNRLLCIFLIGIVHIGFSQSEKNEARFESKNTVKVFPNPATNVINVLGLKNDLNAAIRITDTYGNQVIFHQWDIKNNALNIPVFQLASGIYLITIRSEHQNVRTKFFKQ